MDTNITKTWIIEIDADSVFNRCTDETLYQAYSRNEENPKYDAVVIQDDDRGQFNFYYASALANLQMLLARRMESAPTTSGNKTSFHLSMHDNHDDNIKTILISHCYEYVVRQILEQWYQKDFGSMLEKLEINHCLHYRKNPVRRRFGPLF